MLFLKSFSERIFTSFGVELLDRFKNMQVCSTVVLNLIGSIMYKNYDSAVNFFFFSLIKHYFKINEIQDSDSVCFLLKLIDREGGKEIWKVSKVYFIYLFILF